MTTPPSKQLDQFVIRLPDGMRDRIKAAAEANNRSMNAEIVATLEDAYPAPVYLDIKPLFDSVLATLTRLNVVPPAPYTIEQIARAAVSDAYVGVDSFEPTKAIADKLRAEAIERQARLDAEND